MLVNKKLVLFALFLLALFVFLQPRFVMQNALRGHVSGVSKVPSDYDLEYTSHKFISGNLELAGWYIPANNSKKVLVMAHGYSKPVGGKSIFLQEAKYFNDAGFDVFLFDFGGFGESEGDRTYLGVKEWQEIVDAYLFAENISETEDKQIGFYGVSMGGFASIVAAGKSGLGDFIVAAVPYRNLDSLMEKQLSNFKLPASIFMPGLKAVASREIGENYDQISAETEIKYIKIPIMIIGAKKDRVVAYEDSQTLFGLANEPKQYKDYNEGHLLLNNPEAKYREEVVGFLNSF